MLQHDFILGWKNIADEDYVGASHGYSVDDTAVGTTNGAGPRNMQIFVISADGTVLHALPGFWHPKDLQHELWLAKELHVLWRSNKTRKQKDEMFKRLQLAEITYQSAATRARSRWQGFDAARERKRAETEQRDTFTQNSGGRPGHLKPINVLVHERLAKQPFVKFSKFDIESFVDYGRPYYDNNAKIDGRGDSLLTAKQQRDKVREYRKKQRELRRKKTRASERDEQRR